MTSDTGGKRALVIGFGSIGQRHHRILSDLSLDVAVVSGRLQSSVSAYGDVLSAMEAHGPDYVVIASPTSLHTAHLEAVRSTGFSGPVLVEKPLANQIEEVELGEAHQVYVGYNLRFHPVVVALLDHLSGCEVIALHLYAGQYLPDWRPGRRYQETSSALVAMGGGVLRDLSHDLDLALSIAGNWDAVAAAGGQRSRLDIDTDDVWSIMLRCSSGTISTIDLDYLNRPGARRIVALCNDETVEADVVNGTLSVNGSVQRFPASRDQQYREMHEAVLSGRESAAATYADGIEVMRLISAIEASERDERWITR